MADRQQNINIKFNTNAVDLEKATQLLNKAKAANDALNQSINKTGTEGAQRVNQFSNTIEGLKLQMQQLKAQIDLTNQSDKSRLEALRGQYSAMSTQLKAYQGDLQKTQAAQKSLTDGLGGLYATVRLALTAGLIAETIRATVEMAKLKGTVDGVTRAFNALPNATLLMADLKAKTHGTLDELTLMQKAVQAKNFKIPLEQLGTLLEFAAIKAQQTGLDINYLVNSLITGLGRNSIRLLDNLQISVTELREKTKELGSTQAAVFAIVNKQMRDMGGFLETDATRVDKLSASWKNFKINLAERLETGGVISFFDKVITGWELLLGGSFRFAVAQAEATKAVQEFKKANDQLLDTDKKIQGVELELDKLRVRRLQDGGKIKELQAVIDKGSAVFGSKEDNQKAQLAEKQIEAIKKRNDVTAASIILLEQYAKSLRMGNLVDEEQLGIVEGFNEKVKELNETIEKSTDVTGKEQQAAIKQREEYERLIAVYTLTTDELDKYGESMDKGKISSKSFREEIIKQIDEITARLAKNTKPIGLQRGSQPVGGIMGPLGPADATTDSTNSQALILKTWYSNYATFWDKVAQGFDDMGSRIRKDGQITVEDQRMGMERAVKDLVRNIGQALTGLAQSALEADVRSYDERIDASENYYNEQIRLAGDNENRKSILEKKGNQERAKLEKERGEAAKRAALTTILINTAIGVMKAIATAVTIYDGLVEAAAVAVLGGAQYAIAARQKYAEGEIDIKGPGTSKSDSIPAMLSRGESVITAEATRESMGLLKLIQARRINDRMINEIIANGGGSKGSAVDLSPVVAAIKAQPKPPDYFRQADQIFEVKKLSDQSKQRVRRGFLG